MNSAQSSADIFGVWNMVRAELDGEPAPELVVKNTVLELANGEYLVRFQNETADRGTFELGQRPGVRTLLLRSRDGPNRGRTLPCIIQLTPGRLRVCFSLNGEWPTEFKTAEGQSRYLATYRRNEGTS